MHVCIYIHTYILICILKKGMYVYIYAYIEFEGLSSLLNSSTRAWLGVDKNIDILHAHPLYDVVQQRAKIQLTKTSATVS